MASQPNRPAFKTLPLHAGDPPHSAWGIYGPDDQLGTLNRLTDELTAKAAREEIRTGLRQTVSLNWPLDAQKVPGFNRQAFRRNMFQKPPRIVNDDVWTFNTQSSTQWGGLRHFAYQKEKIFYNGVTLDDIHSSGRSTVNGIHAWADQGIVGRGILLDFHSWRVANDITYKPFETGSISLEQMQAVLGDQGTEIRFGDILFIRSGVWFRWIKFVLVQKSDLEFQVGYIKGYNEMPQEQIEAFTSVVPPHLSGLEQRGGT
ncbi:MAG: hypothetical protein Q9170_004956 [Blastenia crenularia]